MTGPLTKKSPGFFRPGDKRDIKIMNFELEKDAPMKMKEIYEAFHNELADDGWKDPVSGDDKFESLYWERVLANGFKEHHVWWRAVKYPLGDKNTYIRYACKVDVQSLVVRDTEIVYKGKKKKVQHADLVLRVWFFLQLDVDDKLQNTISSFLNLFRKHLYKEEIDQHAAELYNYGQKIQRWLKAYLDMEESGEQPTHFGPEMGYKNQYSP